MSNIPNIVLPHLANDFVPQLSMSFQLECHHYYVIFTSDLMTVKKLFCMSNPLSQPVKSSKSGLYHHQILENPI